MNIRTEVITYNKSNSLNSISWLFGLVVSAIGIVNTFWGNDPYFGIFLLGLSFIYFPPVSEVIKERLGFSIPGIAKIILGILILIAALGVGELFDKVDLMMMDL